MGNYSFLRATLSEMRATGEVTLVDTMYRANLYARATTGTERIIYSSEVILDRDSALRTGLLTLHTADASV